MKLTVKFVIHKNRMGQIRERAHSLTMKAVTEGAFEVQTRAQANAKRDTGAMAGSTYVATPKSSGYGSAAEALAMVDRDVLGQAEPENDDQVLVAVGADYGALLDMGTRYMAGDGWFTNAVWGSIPFIRSRIREALKEL